MSCSKWTDSPQRVLRRFLSGLYNLSEDSSVRIKLWRVKLLRVMVISRNSMFFWFVTTLDKRSRPFSFTIYNFLIPSIMRIQRLSRAVYFTVQFWIHCPVSSPWLNCHTGDSLWTLIYLIQSLILWSRNINYSKVLPPFFSHLSVSKLIDLTNLFSHTI